MVKHIVLWDLIDTLTDEEKETAALKMKSILEDLNGKIPGLLESSVVINQEPSSNRDIALFTTLESMNALAKYKVHPEHVNAGKFIRAVTCNRACIDYEV